MANVRRPKSVRGKKRPRVFAGKQFQYMQKDPAQSEEDSFARPSSASKRKLSSNDPTDNVGMTSGTSSMLLRPRKTCSTSSSSGVDGSEADSWKLSGNRIIACDKLVAFVGMIRHCNKGSLSVSEDNRRGLLTRITVSCGGCGWSCYLADSYEKSDDSRNTRSVLAMRMIGKGEVSLQTFCVVMDLPSGVKSQLQ